MSLDSGFRRSDGSDEASAEFDLLSTNLFFRGMKEVHRG